MLSLLRRKNTSSKTTTQSDDVDLSSWELINITDDEIEEIDGIVSLDGDDVTTDQSENESNHTFPVQAIFEDADDDVIAEQLEDARVDDEFEDDADVDDDVYGDDVDDDLVPWEFKGRFGNQRMGKVMGKKCVPKSKYKLPCFYHHKPKSFYEKTQILVR